MNAGQLTPALILRAYAAGVFPMAESQDNPEIFWVEPTERGVLPLESFHVPKRLARLYRSRNYETRRDCDFAGIVKACAQRPETWINTEIESVFNKLFALGQAHSVEAYAKSGELVGGLYGLAIGGAFFGESMFSLQRDASKVALVALVEHLKERGFTLLDTQFMTDHLKQFGGITIPRDDYLRRLGFALGVDARF